eukprot:3343948-Amphidinium_carterae.1
MMSPSLLRASLYQSGQAAMTCLNAGDSDEDDNYDHDYEHQQIAAATSTTKLLILSSQLVDTW